MVISRCFSFPARCFRLVVAGCIAGFAGFSLPASGSVPFLRASGAPAAPALDGSAADPVWRQSLWAGPLLSSSGAGFPSERTDFAVAADAASLYVAVSCHESLLDPVLQRTHEVKAVVTEADGPVYRDDCVELFVQPAPGSGRYYHLAVNSRGVVYDAACAGGEFDVSWSSAAVCAARTDRAATAWVVELAIPWRALGGPPQSGAQWGFNLARQRTSNHERSCWSPTGGGFHRPEAFGRLGFGAPAVGVFRQNAPGFEQGPQSWRFGLLAERAGLARVRVRYGQYPPVDFSKPWKPGRKKQSLRLDYLLGGPNRCLVLKAPPERNGKTLCFRTAGRLPVEGGRTYRLRARVKTENGVAGKRPVVCSISSYDRTGKAIRTYETALPLPTGTRDWTALEGMWTAPENATDILVWVVKWTGTGASGTFYFDDFQLCPAGTERNLFPNGGIEANADGEVSGWLLASGSAVAASYSRPREVAVIRELEDADGALLLRSPAYRGAVMPRNTAIASSLMWKAGRKDSDAVSRVRDLWVNEGAVVAFPVILRSSHPERYGSVDVVLDVPAFLHLFSPAPRARVVSREAVGGRRKYRIRYSRRALTPLESTRHDTVMNLLLAECGRVPGEDRDGLEVRLHAEVEGTVEEETAIPLRVLPPLRWVRPRVAPIEHWACSSFYRPYFRVAPAEREAIAAMWRQAGFNRIGAVLPAEYRKRWGFSARGHIPLINAPGSLFPGGAEYLAAHPEARAVTFAGKRLPNAFCPTYFLSRENRHLSEVREWLAAAARCLPHLDWDYEVPVTRDGSICACDRCIEAFRRAAKLPAGTVITRENVRRIAKAQWVDWRCRENARIAAFFRRTIKEANPECLFSVYSGYQGKTDEKYGVDWRTMGAACDLVWAGYGRPVAAIAATHAAIGDRPFICGELAWFGSRPWDNARAGTDLFRRLTDGGSGIMTYFNWIVDGRFYEAVSRCAAVAAGFEPFFRWDIDAAGKYHSRYQRRDDLVEVVEGGSAADVAVLVHGRDRLVFGFNETGRPRTLVLRHREWEAGLRVVDVESHVMAGRRHAVELPARGVRIFHVRPGVAVEVGAPRRLAPLPDAPPARDPILAWQGRGTYPGDQVFEVRISPNKSFSGGDSIHLSDLHRTAVLPAGLAPGTAYWWQVRARDAAGGAWGPWSAAGRVVRGMFEEPVTATPAFSPNGDGVLDTFELTAEFVAAVPWQVRITGAGGAAVREFAGRGRRAAVSWDGAGADGRRVKPGLYRYAVIPAGRTDLAAGGRVELHPRVGSRNPGFEICRGFGLTVPQGKVTLEKDYRITLSKTYSMRFRTGKEKTDAYWSNYAGGGIGSAVIPVEPGKTYTFAAHIRPDLEAGEAGIAFTFFTSKGRWAAVPGKHPSGEPSEPVTGSGNWVERRVSLTAPPEAFSAVLFFRLTEAKGTCRFDGVSFGETPPE